MSKLKSSSDQCKVEALWVTLWWNDLWRILGWSKCSELALPVGFERWDNHWVVLFPLQWNTKRNKGLTIIIETQWKSPAIAIAR